MKNISNKLSFLFNYLRKYRYYFNILSYFTLLLIPILFLSIAYYLNMQSTNEQEMKNKLYQDVEGIKNNIDLYLRTIQENQYNLLRDQTIHSYLYPESKITFEKKASLYDVNKVIMRSNSIVYPFVIEMFIYIDAQKVYTAEGTEDFNLFFNKFHKLYSYPPSFWMSRLDRQQEVEILSKTLYLNGRTVLPVVSQYIVNGEYANAVSLFSTSSIDKVIEQHNLVNSSTFIIVDSNGNLVHSYTKDMNANDLERLTDTSRLEHNVDSKVVLKKNDINEKGYLYKIKSDIYDWSYVSFTPVSALSGIYRNLTEFTLLLCGTIIIITFLLSVLLSYKIYSPIRKITELFEEANQQVAYKHTNSSSENEVSRIGQGLINLIQDKSMYQQRFYQFSNQFEEQALLNVLMGRFSGDITKLKQHLHEKYNFTSRTYISCTIQFQFQQSYYKEIQETERLNILSRLKNIVTGVIQSHIRSVVVEYSDLTYVCIIDAEDKGELDIILKQFLSVFESDTHYCILVIGVGSQVEGVNNVRISFEESYTAVEDHQGDTHSVINYAEPFNHNSSYYYSFNDEKQIIHYLQMGSKKELIDKLHKIITHNKQNRITHHLQQQLYSALQSTATKFIQDKQLNVSPEYFSVHQDEKLSVKKLEKLFEKVIELQQIKEEEVHQQEKLIEAIIGYVDQHLTEDLYLEKIASEINVSTKYVSKIFKDKTGTNLTDYISLSRVGLAKEMLIHTQLSIQNIAEQVGIHSRTTFLRTFKKWEGIAPAEYRQLYQKQSNPHYK